VLKIVPLALFGLLLSSCQTGTNENTDIFCQDSNGNYVGPMSFVAGTTVVSEDDSAGTVTIDPPPEAIFVPASGTPTNADGESADPAPFSACFYANPNFKVISTPPPGTVAGPADPNTGKAEVDSPPQVIVTPSGNHIVVNPPAVTINLGGLANGGGGSAAGGSTVVGGSTTVADLPPTSAPGTTVDSSPPANAAATAAAAAAGSTGPGVPTLAQLPEAGKDFSTKVTTAFNAAGAAYTNAKNARQTAVTSGATPDIAAYKSALAAYLTARKEFENAYNFTRQCEITTIAQGYCAGQPVSECGGLAKAPDNTTKYSSQSFTKSFCTVSASGTCEFVSPNSFTGGLTGEQVVINFCTINGESQVGCDGVSKPTYTGNPATTGICQWKGAAGETLNITAPIPPVTPTPPVGPQLPSATASLPAIGASASADATTAYGLLSLAHDAAAQPVGSPNLQKNTQNAYAAAWDIYQNALTNVLVPTSSTPAPSPSGAPPLPPGPTASDAKQAAFRLVQLALTPAKATSATAQDQAIYELAWNAYQAAI